MSIVLFDNPLVEVGAVGLVVLYVSVGVATGRRLHKYQWWALIAAMIALVFTLDGPVDRLEGARLFAAHMFQHLALALVVPPLLLLGTPDWVVRPVWRVPCVRTVMRFLTYPVVAYLLYNSVLVALHSPWLFDAMCRNENFHIAMHLLLLATAILLWWPLLSPIPEIPRLSYPVQLLYIFAWLLPMAAVAAPISVATHVLYPWYLEGPHPFGISPLSDQVLGGLFMWVGAGFYLIGVMTSIFFRWARYQDLDEPEFNLSIPDASP